MNRLLTPALAAAAMVALAGCGSPAPKEPAPEDVAAARSAAMQLGKTLKSRLVAAMEEGGPAAAIPVCSLEAPGIASSVSTETGFDVGRTALKIRNPANAPDAWEEAQLHRFTEAVASGADASGLEVAEIVQTEDGDTFRWAKPIVLEGPCAMCHGTAVSSEISALIAERYPEDQATGFEVGDVRGMFTVSKPL